MIKGKILIVDDEKLLRLSLREDFQREGYQTDAAEDGKEALEMLENEQYDLMLLDIKLPGIDGIEVLQKVKQMSPNPTVIMMTAHGDVETAVEAMRAGASDFISKPFDLNEIRMRVERSLETSHLKEELSYLRRNQRQKLEKDSIIGRSKSARDLLDLAHKSAQNDSTVFLLGESGTGKDLMARYIHFHSLRTGYPFVDINCAALPDTLLETELMGHEKGAFTDAKISKKGLFEHANHGTVFLDEIGDMPLSIQAKVLKLIETRRFRRLGGIREIEVDVRIIAATNRDIQALVKEGKLREDLYYRLKVMTILIAPLRERKGDISLLANHFLRQFTHGHKEERRVFSTEILDYFIRYEWPGNVRELKNVVERALILSGGGVVLPKHLPPEIFEFKGERKGFELTELEIPENGISLEEVEREVLKKALAKTEGNLSKAARLLHITRDTLRYRIKRLGIVI